MSIQNFVAYYDLKQAAITFDFCHFLAGAVSYARMNNCPKTDLVVLADGFRNVTYRESSYTHVERQWRLWNLIVELVKITPQIEDFSLLQRTPTSVAINTYPPNYHPKANAAIPYAARTVLNFHNAGQDVRIFQPSTYALNAADRLLASLGPKVVTITLRKASFDAVRDSKADHWFEFSKILKDRGYTPVIIPDQDDALSDRTLNRYDWNVIDVAAMSVDLRLAIYNRAVMNYVTNGGMVGLFMYSKVPFMWFSVIVEGSPIANVEYYERQGVEYRGKYAWLGEHQHMIWDPDTIENLMTSLSLLP